MLTPNPNSTIESADIIFKNAHSIPTISSPNVFSKIYLVTNEPIIITK